MSMVAPPPTAPAQSKDIISLSSQESIGSIIPATTPSQRTEGTTLGTVVRFCIENYYEIFDEIRDVTEVVPEENLENNNGGRSSTNVESPVSSRNGESSPPISPEIITPPTSIGLRAPTTISTKNREPGTTSASSSPPSNIFKHQPRIRGHAGPPPSAASASMALLAKALADSNPQISNETSTLMEGSRSHSYGTDFGSHGLDAVPSRRGSGETTQPSNAYINSRSNGADGFGAQSFSLRSGSGGGPSASGWTGGRGVRGLPKAKSIISIDKSNPNGVADGLAGRESIKLGRGKSGTMRKSASAGVMGVGVTATGFFTSPGGGS
jgi:hypothetical protein